MQDGEEGGEAVVDGGGATGLGGVGDGEADAGEESEVLVGGHVVPARRTGVGWWGVLVGGGIVGDRGLHSLLQAMLKHGRHVLKPLKLLRPNVHVNRPRLLR